MLLLPRLGLVIQKDRKHDKHLGKPVPVHRGKYSSPKSSSTKYPSVLGLHSIHTKGNYNKNKKEVFFLLVHSDKVDRWNTPGKVEDLSSAKGIRWMGHKEFRVVLQSSRRKNCVEILSNL